MPEGRFPRERNDGAFRTQARRHDVRDGGRAGFDKLCELIVYLAEQCADDPTFSATKLSKMLFFADFGCYAKHLKPITGVEYVRMEEGPAPREFLRARDRLLEAGRIALTKRTHEDETQHRVAARGEVNFDLFSPAEISMVDRVIRETWGRSASEISRTSPHRGWQIAPLRASIPYQAAFISDEKPTEADTLRALELNAARGWVERGE
jgi:hypothetical protein